MRAHITDAVIDPNAGGEFQPPAVPEEALRAGDVVAHHADAHEAADKDGKTCQGKK